MKKDPKVAATCATCPAALTQADLSMRCRRCGKCRSATPGKQKLAATTDPTKRTFGQFTISHPKKVPKATTESWWLRPELQGDRAAFQQHAVDLHPGSKTSAKGLA